MSAFDPIPIAEKLCGADIKNISHIKKGGNSRIYAVETDTARYALKFYPTPSEKDPRNRMAIESHALIFLQQQGVENVPRVVAEDNVENAVLLSWLDGEHMFEVTDADVTAFAGFLIQLAQISEQGRAYQPALAEASEACLSGARIISHVEKRLPELKAAAQHHAALDAFLNETIIYYMDVLVPRAKEAFANAGLSIDQDLPAHLQVLIPSDYGSHNALRGAETIQFLDFEYFGWDDPVTSVVNFLLHPAMDLTPTQQEAFWETVNRYFIQKDVTYLLRLEHLLPLYTARWCCIILGEFIPGVWRNRVQSGRYEESERVAVLMVQLEKARRCTHRSEHIRHLIKKVS